MPRPPEPRFVHEFTLAPTLYQARILRIRLDLGRQMYNAMLGEAQARVDWCKRDPRWQEARHLKQAGEATEARTLYKAIERDVILTERLRYEPDFTGMLGAARLKDPASGIMTRLRQAHFRDHLDFKSVQGLATRAYRTVDRVRFLRPTRRRDGSLRFPRAHFLPKGEARAMDSTSILWHGDHITWNSPLRKLDIPICFDHEDTRGVQAHAVAQMQDPANICEGLRVLTRTVRGEERWYVQTTIKGWPQWDAQRYPPGHGKTIAIDFGPSQIGLCYEASDGTLHGRKLELAAGLRHDYARIRRLQRYLDRSRRATNPSNYNDNGTVKKGLRRSDWHYSRRYLTAKAQLADLWRRYAASRKNLLGKLANELITRGTIIKIEALNYKAWQKHWGKSIGRGAPGMLVRLLKTKLQHPDVQGELIEFPTRHTKCSQLCHGCGQYKKKPLSLRTHRCECGVGPVDRDVYSAFLAYHYNSASKTLDIGAARAAFAALQCGATDIQGIDQAASVPSPVEVPSAPMAGADQSGSVALRALARAEAPVDPYAGERRAAIPTFQISTQFASIEAGMESIGDARSNPDQEQRQTPMHAGNNKAPRAPRRRRCSQKSAQLSLFPGL